jgi:hypothetical protein
MGALLPAAPRAALNHVVLYPRASAPSTPAPSFAPAAPSSSALARVLRRRAPTTPTFAVERGPELHPTCRPSSVVHAPAPTAGPEPVPVPEWDGGGVLRREFGGVGERVLRIRERMRRC